MGKAMFLMVALFVLGVGFILLKGANVVAPTMDEGASEISAPSLPDLNVKENAAAAGTKIKEGAKTLATKAGVIVEVKPTVLRVDREPIELLPGGKADVKVIRSGGTLAPQKLELIPAPGTKLRASGGEFKAGETETTITVEAASGAQDSGLTIKAGDAVKVVPVKIK